MRTDNVIVERDVLGHVSREGFSAVSAVATRQATDDLAARRTAAIESRGYEPLAVIPLAILDSLCI